MPYDEIFLGKLELKILKLDFFIEWLIGTAFRNKVPSVYSDIFASDQVKPTLKSVITKSLCSGEFYAGACTNIFENENKTWNEFELLVNNLQESGIMPRVKKIQDLHKSLQVINPVNIDNHVAVIESIIASKMMKYSSERDIISVIRSLNPIPPDKEFLCSEEFSNFEAPILSSRIIERTSKLLGLWLHACAWTFLPRLISSFQLSDERLNALVNRVGWLTKLACAVFYYYPDLAQFLNQINLDEPSNMIQTQSRFAHATYPVCVDALLSFVLPNNPVDERRKSLAQTLEDESENCKRLINLLDYLHSNSQFKTQYLPFSSLLRITLAFENISRNQKSPYHEDSTTLEDLKAICAAEFYVWLTRSWERLPSRPYTAVRSKIDESQKLRRIFRSTEVRPAKPAIIPNPETPPVPVITNRSVFASFIQAPVEQPTIPAKSNLDNLDPFFLKDPMQPLPDSANLLQAQFIRGATFRKAKPTSLVAKKLPAVNTVTSSDLVSSSIEINTSFESVKPIPDQNGKESSTTSWSTSNRTSRLPVKKMTRSSDEPQVSTNTTSHKNSLLHLQFEQKRRSIELTRRKVKALVGQKTSERHQAAFLKLITQNRQKCLARENKDSYIEELISTAEDEQTSVCRTVDDLSTSLDGASPISPIEGSEILNQVPLDASLQKIDIASTGFEADTESQLNAHLAPGLEIGSVWTDKELSKKNVNNLVKNSVENSLHPVDVSVFNSMEVLVVPTRSETNSDAHRFVEAATLVSPSAFLPEMNDDDAVTTTFETTTAEIPLEDDQNDDHSSDFSSVSVHMKRLVKEKRAQAVGKRRENHRFRESVEEKTVPLPSKGLPLQSNSRSKRGISSKCHDEEDEYEDEDEEEFPACHEKSVPSRRNLNLSVSTQEGGPYSPRYFRRSMYEFTGSDFHKHDEFAEMEYDTDIGIHLENYHSKSRILSQSRNSLQLDELNKSISSLKNDMHQLQQQIFLSSSQNQSIAAMATLSQQLAVVANTASVLNRSNSLRRCEDRIPEDLESHASSRTTGMSPRPRATWGNRSDRADPGIEIASSCDGISIPSARKKSNYRGHHQGLRASLNTQNDELSEQDEDNDKFEGHMSNMSSQAGLTSLRESDNFMNMLRQSLESNEIPNRYSDKVEVDKISEASKPIIDFFVIDHQAGDNEAAERTLNRLEARRTQQKERSAQRLAKEKENLREQRIQEEHVRLEKKIQEQEKRENLLKAHLEKKETEIGRPDSTAVVRSSSEQRIPRSSSGQNLASRGRGKPVIVHRKPSNIGPITIRSNKSVSQSSGKSFFMRQSLDVSLKDATQNESNTAAMPGWASKHTSEADLVKLSSPVQKNQISATNGKKKSPSGAVSCSSLPKQLKDSEKNSQIVSDNAFATNPPPVKLFVKPKGKSNRTVIANALTYCCLAGAVNKELMQSTLKELNSCDASTHFAVLFRDHRCQYRALYYFDTDTEGLIMICGTGPKRITHDMVELFFKYNSGSKKFMQITTTNHLSTIVDAISIYGYLWSRSSLMTNTNGESPTSQAS